MSDFQVAALNAVVDALEKYGLDDPQKHYFVLIDDLDKKWMPDDTLYLDLIGSLLSTVNELKRRLRRQRLSLRFAKTSTIGYFKKRRSTNRSVRNGRTSLLGLSGRRRTSSGS